MKSLKFVANYAAIGESDEYLSHRLCQAFELSEFINLTSQAADFVLLMADLNMTADEPGFKMLKSSSNLYDSFAEAKVTETEVISTEKGSNKKFYLI